MKAKKRILSLLLCGALLFSLCPQAAFAEGAEAGGLCEHHPQHTAECGYTEGSEGTPCSHEHTEDCYTLVTECVHEHGSECYPEESVETAEAESVSGNTATPSEPEEQEPTACTHECSEESGCITKKLDCQHEHDGTCGYTPATEGTPCGYVCEICNPQDSGEAEDTEPEAECTCTELCTEEPVNAECPVCGAEGADLTACEGVGAEIATLSNALAAEPKADTGVFTVEGGTLGTDYTYTASTEASPNGGDVLTIKSETPLTISTNNTSEESGGCRIVIENGVTANITLAGVNITPADASTDDGYSGIELGNNASLNITLQSGSSNVINGGTSTTGLPGPGIHVPEDSTLTITGNGSLKVHGASGTYAAAVGIGGMGSSSGAGGACGNVIILGGTITVHGGTSTTGSAPVDIGGGATDNGNGGDCSTVIILTSVNSDGNLEIGGGAGVAVGGGKGSDGAGIKPSGDGNYTVYGDLELPCDITIPAGAKVVIPEGASLTVPEGKKLTNNGTILMQGGNYTNSGTLTGNQPTYPSTVTVSVSQDGASVASVPYGSTVTITATMEKVETAANALSADTGKVNFYLGDANDTTGIKLDTGTVEFKDGAYTASVEVTLDDEKGVTEVGTITITADFGGYAPEGNESGDSLAPNTGSAELTVVESYSIDYEEETITIAEGFSLYEAETEGNAIFTSNGENNTISLTEYIQSTNKTLYLQAPSAGADEQPDRREITIPARPQALTITPTINYEEEKLSFSPDITATTLEYALSQPDSDWKDVPSSAALSEMGWTGNQMTVYFRTGATESAFASAATQSPLNIPARPAAPNGLNLMDWTDVSVTYYVGEGVQCRLNNEGDWATPEPDETDYTFTGLTPQTTYTIYARYPATDSQFASAESSDEITTKSSAADAPEVGAATVTDTTVTLPYNAAWEYQMGDDDWRSIQNPNVFTGLTAATQYTYHVRVAETQTAEASEIATVTVWTSYAAPAAGAGYTIHFDTEALTVETGYEVNTTEDFTGTGIPSSGSLADYTGGTLYIRHKADEGGAPASAAVAISIPARPAAPAVQGINETVAGRNDGKITGLTVGTAYEISTDSGQNWQDAALTGTEIVGLAPGTYQVRVKGTESSFSGAVAEVAIATGAERTYTLNVAAPTFESVYTGYTQPEAKAITITSSGNSDATISSVTVNGTNFTIGGNGSTVPAGESITTWTIRPAAGLAVGTHTATITVAYDNGATATAEVSFVVNQQSSGGGSGGGTSYDYYTISASAGAGGSISPSGNISVREGRDKTFTITPADGYVISDVRVDGVSVGAVLSYTFDNVQKRHTIEAFFAKENPDTGNPFTDVHPNDWFYNDVMFVYQNGLMNGTSATTFSPNDPITRAQVAVIFYRMAGSPEVTGDSAFTDVENGPGTAWYYNAVLWAQQNGIVSGYGDGTFRPGTDITREQLAVIFYNYAKLKGYDVSATNDLSGFTDAGDVSDWALPAMRWAVGSGIMGGYGDGILGPQGTATRAQVAAMLCRFIENNKLVPPTVAPGGDSGTTGTGGTGSGGGDWTQQKPVPQTGDNSNIGLWISLMLLSLSGIVVLLVTEKVRRRRMEAEEAPDPLTI